MTQFNEARNLARVFERDTYPPATYRKRIKVSGWSDARLVWESHAAAGVASFTIYSSIDNAPPVVDDLDPATNTTWVDETPFGAIFNALPNNAIGNGKVDLGPNPAIYTLLVVMVVTTELTDFEMKARGQGRGG